jgi:homoprotocatechuate degradation regulator HpaR
VTNGSRHSLRSLERSLPLALLRARENLMRRFRPLLAEHDLTEQQWRVLRVLDDSASPLSVGEISAQAVLLGPSLSRILAALERRGLLRRRHDSHDNRRSEIELTSAGHRLVARIAPTSEAAYRHLEADFGEEDLRLLEAALERLAHV